MILLLPYRADPCNCMWPSRRGVVTSHCVQKRLGVRARDLANVTKLYIGNSLGRMLLVADLRAIRPRFLENFKISWGVAPSRAADNNY